MVKLLYVVSQRHAAIILKSKGMYFFQKKGKNTTIILVFCTPSSFTNPYTHPKRINRRG